MSLFGMFCFFAAWCERKDIPRSLGMTLLGFLFCFVDIFIFIITPIVSYGR